LAYKEKVISDFLAIFFFKMAMDSLINEELFCNEEFWFSQSDHLASHYIDIAFIDVII
jgi:hypothetical protein